MAFSDFFKKKKSESPSPAEELFQNAKEQFDKGERQQAFQTLAGAFREDVDYKPLYRLASDCLTALGAEEEKALFENALNNFNKAGAFADLGSHFSSSGDYMLAQPFLKKALSLDSNNIDTAHDLAIAYARRFQVGAAIEALESVNVHTDFWALWFLTKCKILHNEIQDASVFITKLEMSLEGDNEEEVEIPRLKVEELKEMLTRHKTISKPEVHIRDWQFIQYGGAILDYFDEEEDRQVAGGRYVASWGSHESIREVVGTLKEFIEGLSVPITSVKYLYDRNSEITGKAIAKVLAVPASVFNADEENTDCLIVAADSASLNEYELNRIDKGQVVFALNHGWLQSSYVSPDIAGFITQSYYFPWDGNGFKVVDAASMKIEKTESDERTTDEIANDIANTSFDASDNSALLAFYKERREHLKGIGNKTNDQRYNFMIESPVPGAYFGFG